MALDTARPDELALLTGGRVYGGWTTVIVGRSIEQLAGGFSVSVSERWPGQDAVRAIAPGEKFELMLGGARVMTGWVDTVDLGMDHLSHTVEVSGRDLTGDLVDCSAVSKTGQWQGQKIEAIARDLARPFGLKVRDDVDTGVALASFALQEGETVFEAIERAARIRALLLTTDGDGTLVITRAGVKRVSTTLMTGVNILDCRARLDLRDRFAEYTAKGQAPGDDYFNAEAVSQIRAVAKDPGVTRYRPLVLTNDAPDLAATLRQRVQWEANVRAARSTEVQVTVQGWRHATGLWEPNTIVRLVAPPLRIDADLLISSVQYSLDQRGTVTTLQLTRADAYKLLPTALQTASGAAGSAANWLGLPRTAEAR